MKFSIQYDIYNWINRIHWQVIESMVNFIRDVVEKDLNGTRSGDKLLASLVTNAFTNLVAEPRYLNYESMVSVWYWLSGKGKSWLYKKDLLATKWHLQPFYVIENDICQCIKAKNKKEIKIFFSFTSQSQLFFQWKLFQNNERYFRNNSLIHLIVNTWLQMNYVQIFSLLECL